MAKYGMWLALAVCVAVVGCGKPEAVTAGGKTATQWTEKLKDKDPARRTKAVTKLGALIPHDKDAFPAVLGALKDEAPAVRSEAAKSLGKFARGKENEALVALRDLKEREKEQKVLEEVVRAIEKLSPADAKAGGGGP
jgi:HEAT repeat protein